MDTTNELLLLEARRCDAQIAADVETLDALFDDRLTWTHSSARQDTKASLLDSVRSGRTRYLSMKRSDEQVRVHGHVAVVTGLVEMRAVVNGEEKDLRNRYTNVWAKTDGAWRLVAWQSTGAPR